MTPPPVRCQFLNTSLVGSLSAQVIRPVSAPLVSVIIPTYNRAQFIAEASSSTCRQTVAERVETIVVDDGSTDNTSATVQSMTSGPGGLLLLGQRNSGPSAARNTGLAFARGRFIQLLDSDDIIAEKKLELQIERLSKTPSANFATCVWARHREGTGEVVECKGWEKGESWAILPGFLKGDVWQTGTPLYRRETCELAGPWPEDMRCLEDWLWHVRMGFAGAKGIHVREQLLTVREHSAERLSTVSPLQRLDAYNLFARKIKEDIVRCPSEFLEDVACLFFQVGRWNCRYGKGKEAALWLQEAIRLAPFSAKQICYRLVYFAVGLLGPGRAVALWDTARHGRRLT